MNYYFIYKNSNLIFQKKKITKKILRSTKKVIFIKVIIKHKFY